MTPPLLSAALLALTLTFSAPAAAATDQGPGQPPAEGGQAMEPQPDDGELTEFVAAFVRLVGVQHGYMMLMQSEEDPAKLEDLKTSAIEDMTTAVEQDGLSVDRYNQIATALRSDTELQGRVEGIMQQMAETPPEE